MSNQFISYIILFIRLGHYSSSGAPIFIGVNSASREVIKNCSRQARTITLCPGHNTVRMEILSRIDPYAIGSRTLLNRFRLPDGVKDILSRHRIRHERQRAHQYVEIYNRLLKRAEKGGFQKGQSILEVGLGPGILATAYQKEGLNVIGLDIEDLRVEEGRKMPLVIFRDNIPLQWEKFDYVSLTSVLHHLPPDLQTNFFQQAISLLNPTGLILIQEDIRGRNPVEHLAIRLVDKMASGSEANSHKTEGEWELFFNRLDLTNLASDKIVYGKKMFRLVKQFFVLTTSE